MSNIPSIRQCTRRHRRPRERCSDNATTYILTTHLVYARSEKPTLTLRMERRQLDYRVMTWVPLKLLVRLFMIGERRVMTFVPRNFSSNNTICIISIKTVYAIYCIYLTATFIKLNSTFFTVHLDLREPLPWSSVALHNGYCGLV